MKNPPYTMYVLYAAFLFWPSICSRVLQQMQVSDTGLKFAALNMYIFGWWTFIFVTIVAFSM